MSCVVARRSTLCREFVHSFAVIRGFSTASSTPFVNASGSPSQSSGIQYQTLDDEILHRARRTVFVPPTGVSRGDCWKRLNELLLSEKNSANSLRLGDLFLISNVLVSNHALTAVSEARLVNLVNDHVGHRGRLPNMFTLIQYLRFQKLLSLPVHLEIVHRTLSLPLTFKVSELLEVFWLCSSCGNIVEASIFPEFAKQLANKVRLATTPSDLRSNGVLARKCLQSICSQLGERSIHHESLYPFLLLSTQTLEFCVGLSVNSSVIGTLIRSSLQAHDLADARPIANLAKTLKTSFPEILVEMEKLNSEDFKLFVKIAKLDLDHHRDDSASSSSSHHSLLDEGSIHESGESLRLPSKLGGVFKRMKNDHENYPLFSNGGLFVYYSSVTSCWQIGPDPERPMLRTAFHTSFAQDGVSRDELRNVSAWKVYSKSLKRFIDATAEDNQTARSGDGLKRRSVPSSSSMLSVGVDSVERQGSAASAGVPAEGLTDIASVEESVSHWKGLVEPLSVVEKEAVDIKRMESMIIELCVKVANLEQRVIESEAAQHASVKREEDRIERPQEQARAEFDQFRPSKILSSLTESINSLGKGRSGLIPVGLVPSFDTSRANLIQAEKIQNTSKLIARKLRST